MVVEEGGTVHLARRTRPVQTKGQWLPAGLRTQFFLPHIVSPTATGLTHTTTHHHHVDQATVVHIHVVPVVHCRTHQNHGFTMGFVSSIGEFTRHFDHFIARYTGDFFLPGRSAGHVIIIVTGNTAATQATIETVVSHHQVVNGRNYNFIAVSICDGFSGHVTHLHFVMLTGDPVLVGIVSGKVWESNCRHIATNQCQLQFSVSALIAFALFNIPFTFFTPAVTDSPLWGDQLAIALIDTNGFPFRVVFLTQIACQIGGTQEAAWF
ncbi:hypothetical protein imdm_1615 [gamma proteobacterium IMCC2047]|nr:hypothetical protein imdm_1615 [gamma proteobacterium IMCC2047]